MRRIPACVLILLGFGLLLAPGQALAAAGVRYTLGAAPASHVGSAARLGGAKYNISGTVLGYSGNRVAGADVFWGWMSPNGYQNGGPDHATSANGQFSIAGVSSHPGSDDLWVWYGDLKFLESWGYDFSTSNNATPYSYTVQPGAVSIQIANAPATLGPLVDVYGAGGIAQSFASLSSGTGLAWAAPPSFDDVVVHNFLGSGDPSANTVTAEWIGSSAVSVAAGTPAADPVAFDWNQAQHAYLAGPICRHSGMPGTVVRMVLRGWPAGEEAGFWLGGGKGYDKVFSTKMASKGAGKTYVVKLLIPKKTSAGVFGLATYRADDQASNLSMVDYFQVCTFASSAKAIYRGNGIRLSGKVPSSAGYVYLFARSRAAGQPGTLAAKGWVKVGRYRLKSGKFTSRLLHPNRTTWYVARYPGGHGANFMAFTSVVRVRVH